MGFLFACQGKEKTVSIPSTVLPREKMAQTLTDLHLAEAEATVFMNDSTHRDSISFEKVFIKNKITKAQYDESISFYISHPELLNEIYQEVVNQLSKMQGESGKVK